MRQLILENNRFLLEDKSEYQFNENMMLEISSGIFVRVIVSGTVSFKGSSKNFREFIIIKP